MPGNLDESPFSTMTFVSSIALQKDSLATPYQISCIRFIISKYILTENQTNNFNDSEENKNTSEKKFFFVCLKVFVQ